MHVRKAGPADLSSIVELDERLDLAYPGMEGDAHWVAEADRGRIVGAVALKKHPDCLELCALGVDPGFRGKGIAKALVDALMASAKDAVHLATVIPGFFRSCGFHVIEQDIPEAFPAKRKTAWCEGCRQALCTVMRRDDS
jgi:N-acetylglutamate synthase-like GNAT family acetyltransferase